MALLVVVVVINECCSEAHGAHVEFVWWGGVCTVIFVSTPSPTDLDWTVRLDWSLTIIFKFQSNFTNNAACLFGCTSFLQFI